MTGNIVKLPRIKQTKSVTGDISAQTVVADKNKTLSQVTVNPVSGSSLGTATPQDVLSGKTFSSGSGISVTGTGVKGVHIYGATWAGTSDPSWTRTDEAANFSDPNPYYAGMSGTPSSPFDGLMPWAGMRRVTDSAAGELVEIPKFWYKWTRSGAAMQLQIADGPVEGFYVSPAHADRGDGVGERDYVYVGRYHCASNYLSKTGVLPKTSTSRTTYRSNIHNLRSDAWQWDFAMFWTTRMLYIVEFAHFDSQAKIGKGSGNGAKGNMGYTDNMPYHTGTSLSSRSSYGYGTQYRYMEGLWDNVNDYCDGINLSSCTLYMTYNPANFTDTRTGGAGAVNIGSMSKINGTGGQQTYSKFNEAPSNYPWALSPYELSGSTDYSLWSTDIASVGTNGNNFRVGGAWDQQSYYGMFFFYCFDGASHANEYAGSRLMVLPSSRIN